MVVVGATCWVPAVGGGAPVPRSLNSQVERRLAVISTGGLRDLCAALASALSMRSVGYNAPLTPRRRDGYPGCISVRYFQALRRCRDWACQSLEGRSSAADNPDCGNRMWLRGLLYEEI